mgnify:CR=1 FL=1
MKEKRDETIILRLSKTEKNRIPPRSFPSWEASSADFCLCSRFKMLDLFC